MRRNQTVPSILSTVLTIALALGGWGAVEAAGYPFTDDFESGLGNWTAESPWGATTAYYASPVNSATDSPSTYYGTSVDASLTLATSVDLTSATLPVLRFRHRYQIEDGYDFGYVEVSTDDGSSWDSPVASYTGAIGAWAREQIDLADYAGYANVRVRFRLVTDSTVVADGWYVDDVVIAEGPSAINLDTPVTVTTNSVDLTWDESLEGDFSVYRIYRSTSSSFDWSTATLVTEIDDSSTLSHTDITVTPKSTFYYQVMVLTTSDLHSLSNEVSATTLVGMDYPFLDDGEGTATAWSADPPWALTTENANSGSHSWSDSPGGDYGNSIPSQSLTLVSPIDLTSATSPVLSFNHSWIFAAGDSGNVEISTDDGSSWTPLATFTNGTSDGWARERFDLSAYGWSNDVLVRFRTTTDTSTGADGWYVDDISVAESPTMVDPPILDEITSHSMRLSWARCSDLLFSHYAIHRSTSPGPGINSELVAEIFDQDTTSFTNTGLAVDTDYYYRIYAVSPYGTYSPDSTSESTQRTGGNPYPFYDDFEGDLDNWNRTGDWGTTATDQHGGANSLTDSPDTTYDPSTTWEARTTVDLSTSTWPVLRFWDRYAFADTGDWAFLDVSPDGSSWYRLYSGTLTRSTWTEQQIDLSPWRTTTNLRIRFTVTANGSGADAGWYLDDLSIDEHPGSPISLPYFENFEAGTGDWLTSSWAPSADSPHAGITSVRSTPNGWMSTRSELAIELAGELDLSGVSNPQLTFWLRGNVGEDGGFAAQVSTNGGLSWVSIPGGSIGEYWNHDWTRFQVPLNGYLQSGLRFRFLNTNGRYGGQSNLFIDDISIEEMPEAVLLNPLTPHLKSVDLSWEESTLGNFERYEVYRSTSANVTVANDLIYSSTDSADTSYTDMGRSIGATYYYRVFVFNSRDVATPSNERSATTVPLTFPFTDSMENLDNWDATGTWGPDGMTPHEGSFSLNDSPGDNSPINSNTYILTAIDLSGSTWPVLRFWDRYGMSDDWGYLQVSTDGNNWTMPYSVTGAHPAWAERNIDLSPWKTATNLRIRFTIATGGANVDEGWYIDELSVTDHSGTVSLPFFDDMESGTGNWLPAIWEPSADTPHSGAVSIRSTTHGTMKNYSQNGMELAGELDLSGATDPQLTFWLRGSVGDDGGFSAQVSTDGGISWATVPGTGLGQFWAAVDWTRFQVSLNGYLQSGLRFRFINTNGKYGGPSNLFVDDVSIEEMPANVTLDSPDQATISSMRLSWNDLNDPDFAAYAVYRSQNPTVNTASDLVATITEQTTTEFVDTGLQARTTYYYRVYFIDTANVYSPSNTVSATTLGVVMPFDDDFESDSGVWTVTGEWGTVIDAGVGGSTSLGDSPADLNPNVDTWAVTGVDLTGTAWPVLAFSERFDFGGHWGYVQISSDGGSGWTTVYAATGSQTEWVSRRFDLSPWREQSQVWIRFFINANAGVASDGWHIDNLFIGENPIEGSSGYPFFDGLENGAGHWLNGPWALTDDSPYEGDTAILDTPASRPGYSELWLTYGSELDLSGAIDPLLTLQVRGNTAYRNYFRGQVSTDGGLTWQDLGDIYIGPEQNLPDWTRMQTSLSGYLVENLRLRFRVYGNYSGDPNIFLDNIAVGEQTPTAPTLNSPTWGADEPTVRPTLMVNNAIDYQSDLMNYEYQVFDDAGLTNIVAEVPSVAGGVGTTSWPIDEDLLLDTQYWWRCRATDEHGNTGPWMDTATFFVQLTDHPPTVPVLLGPSDGAEVPDLGGRLTWLESTDPDEDNGDYVAGYRVQVDEDPGFGSPEIDVAEITLSTKATGAISVTLSGLTGSDSLVTGTLYHWRVNAKDSHGVASEWSASPARFVFGDDESAPTCSITSPTDDATVTDTPITISGTASDDLSGVNVVEISTDGGTTWVQGVGAESWSHQWWPPLSGDYELSCRATDLAENPGAASASITVHADLDRTMSFAQSSASVEEDAGTYNVTVNLSAIRATEVTAELVVSGTATSGVDFDEPPQTVRFFPGQTTLVFPITISDDAEVEYPETLVLTLSNPNLPDVIVGTNASIEITIEGDYIFEDGFEENGTGNWSSVVGASE